MHAQPLISIIVPVYNAALYLPQCLESIIHQTYENLEIICVNDESTDSSLEILNKYKELDDRIQVIDKKNEGVSFARNAALDIANGQYVLFVDSDDWIDLDTCKNAIEKIQDADVLMWSYVREFGSSSLRKVIFDQNVTFDQKQVLEKLHRRMIGIADEEMKQPENADALCTIWGKLYRRTVIGDIRFVDIREIGSYEDGIFNLNVFEKAKKVRFINEYHYHYRKTNASSITTVYRPEQAEKFRALFQIMQDYIQAGMWGDSYQKALNNRIALSVLGLTLNISSSNKSFIGKLKEERQLLSHPVYRQAFRDFSMKYLPFHWKLFYGAAKMNCAAFVCALGICMKLVLQQK